jgi:hypothetical protein
VNEDEVNEETPAPPESAKPTEDDVAPLRVDTAVITRCDRAGRPVALLVSELIGVIGVIGVLGVLPAGLGGAGEAAAAGDIPHVEQKPCSMTPSQFFRAHTIWASVLMVDSLRAPGG